MSLKRFFIPAIILLLLLLAVSCSSQSAAETRSPTTATAPASAAASPALSAEAPPSATDTAALPSSAPESPSPSDFISMRALGEIEALFKTDGNEKEALDTMRSLLPEMSADWAASAVSEYEAYQTSAIEKTTLIGQDLVDLIRKTMTQPYDEKTLADLSKIQDPDLKKALQEFNSRGYKIVIPEGNFQAVIDYGAYKEFEAFLPPDFAAYIEIMAEESESRTSEDAGLIIPADTVFKRALGCEQFLGNYSRSPRANKIKVMYNNYVDIWFFGENNTPAFDYETNKLTQEFFDSYQKEASDSTGSALQKAAYEYLKVLKGSNNTLTQAVTDFRKTTTDNLKIIPSYG